MDGWTALWRKALGHGRGWVVLRASSERPLHVTWPRWNAAGVHHSIKCWLS